MRERVSLEYRRTRARRRIERAVVKEIEHERALERNFARKRRMGSYQK